MAKVHGPLFSNTASGSVGPVLTFSERKTCHQCRFQRKQKDVISVLRTAQRFKFSQGLILWQSLPQEEKDLWKLY